jgi:hypothetical protein
MRDHGATTPIVPYKGRILALVNQSPIGNGLPWGKNDFWKNKYLGIGRTRRINICAAPAGEGLA